MENENEGKVVLCKLCFISCGENFEAVDNIKRKMLETVQIELDFATSTEPVICKCCSKNLRTSFDFKKLCLCTEDCINSFFNEQNCGKLNLTGVYLNGVGNESSFNLFEDHTVCRLCMELIKDGSYIPLGGGIKDAMYFSQYFPELNLSITLDPVICTLCHSSLQDYIGFKNHCSFAIKKLQTPYVGEETDSDNQFKPTLEPELILLKNAVKYENDYQLNMDKEYPVSDDIDGLLSKSEYLMNVEYEESFLKAEPDDNKIEYGCDSSLSSLSETSTEQATYTYHQKTYHKCETQTPHEPLLYQCKSCPFKTKYVTSIRQHMEAVHNVAPEQQVYPCNQCEYETTCKDSHKSRLLSHRGPSDTTVYRCEDCQFTTKYKRNLKRHKLVHQNGPEVKKYQCKVCQFETKHKGRLGLHMVVHQNESEVMLYRCEQCKFKTKHKSSLGKHLLTHKTV